jgi:hypothetical protein
MRLLILLLLCVGIYTSVEAQLVELVDFNHSQCQESVGDYTIRVRIVSKTLDSDTLKLSIGFASACCMQFNGVAEMKNDTLHVRLERTTEDACFCSCCYQADFTITGIKDINIPIKFYNRVIEYSADKYVTFSPTYSLVKRDTINYTDKYGLKQGKWFEDEKKLPGIYK